MPGCILKVIRAKKVFNNFGRRLDDVSHPISMPHRFR